MWEIMGEIISVLPTLTPSQGLRKCPLTMKILAQDVLHVNNMCGKLHGHNFYTHEDVRNLPYCSKLVVVNGFPQSFSQLHMLVDCRFFFNISVLTFKFGTHVISTKKIHPNLDSVTLVNRTP